MGRAALLTFCWGLIGLALTFPGSASALTQVSPEWTQDGPVVAGENAVWADIDRSGVATVHAASERGDNRVLAHLEPPSGRRYRLLDIAGSDQLVAFVSNIPGEWTGTVWAGRIGDIKQIDAQNGISTVDVDGSTVAWMTTDWENGPGVVVVDDLATPDPPVRINTPSSIFESGEVRVAGPYVAWYEYSALAERSSVNVWNWQTNQAVYSVDMQRLRAANGGSGTAHFDLDTDGTLALAFQSGAVSAHGLLGYYTPAEPYAHLVSSDIQDPRVTIAHGLMAVCRHTTQDMVVLDKTGAVQNRFDRFFGNYVCPERGGEDLSEFGQIGFDGKHLAWANPTRQGIWLSEYPSTTVPADPRLVTGPPTTTAHVSRSGSLTVASQRISCHAYVGKRCSALATVSWGRSVLGRSKLIVSAGKMARVSAKLSRRGRGVVRLRGRLMTTLRLDVRDPLGAHKIKRVRLALNAR